MKYFKNPAGEVFGYDEKDASQRQLICDAKDSGWLDVSATWPPTPTESDAIKLQIATLEASITSRRLREAVLGVDGGWLAKVDGEIEILRAKLS